MAESFPCRSASENATIVLDRLNANAVVLSQNIDLDINDDSNVALDAVNAGNGGGLLVNNQGTGDLLDLQDGGNSVLKATDGGNLEVGDLTVAGNTPMLVVKGDDDSDNDPGVIVLYDHTGTANYLWVDNTGDLRIHTSAPTNEASDGTVVGAQTA